MPRGHNGFQAPTHHSANRSGEVKPRKESKDELLIGVIDASPLRATNTFEGIMDKKLVKIERKKGTGGNSADLKIFKDFPWPY